MIKFLEKLFFKASESKIEKLVGKSLNALEGLCTEDLFARKNKIIFVCFDIPKSKYTAMIKIFKNDYGEEKWRVSVVVFEEGSDEILEIYIAKIMTDDEVIKYFRKVETKAEILKTIIELNEKAADSFDF